MGISAFYFGGENCWGDKEQKELNSDVLTVLHQPSPPSSCCPLSPLLLEGGGGEKEKLRWQQMKPFCSLSVLQERGSCGGGRKVGCAAGKGMQPHIGTQVLLVLSGCSPGEVEVVVRC